MSERMGHLTFGINVTLDGCVDHREGVVDDETHAHQLYRPLATSWQLLDNEMPGDPRLVAAQSQAGPPAILDAQRWQRYDRAK